MKSAAEVGADEDKEVWFRTIDFALKDVLVELAALGAVLPTFSLGLTKSAFFSFFLFAEAPILLSCLREACYER